MTTHDTAVTVATPPPVLLPAGGTAEARILVTVAEAYHVQANPASEEFLVPVQLRLRGKGGVRAKQPTYPPSQMYRLQGTTEDLMTYEGTFPIVVPVEAAASTPPGDYLLRGVLRYQACDARTCLFPTSVPVALTFRVVPNYGPNVIARPGGPKQSRRDGDERGIATPA